MQKKIADLSYDTKSNNSNASYWNTINPLSQLSGDNVDRIPESLASWLPIANQDTRYLVFKTGAAALLAAAAVAGVRAVQHLGTVDTIRKADAPGERLQRELDSTFNVEEGVTETALKEDDDEDKWDKHASLDKQSLFTDYSVAIPTIAALLSAAAAYKATDSWADSRKKRILDNTIRGKNEHLRDLIVARAQNASGNISKRRLNAVLNRPDFEEEGVPEDEESYISDLINEDGTKKASLYKQSAMDKEAIVGATTKRLGLVASLLFLASSIGSYTYFKNNNANNIRYKAYKKGLSEYAMARSLNNTLTLSTGDGEIFDQIDDSRKKKEDKKKEKREKALDTKALELPDNKQDDVYDFLGEEYTPKNNQVSVTL